MTVTRPLDDETLQVMAEHIGSATYEMAEGEARWSNDGNLLAGRASVHALRALIEFLVGRASGHKKSDIMPSDYHPSWRVDHDEVRLLRERLRYVDQSAAHLSLSRVEPEQSWPERWHDTVLRVLKLIRRFSDEISRHPAHAHLRTALENAERAISAEDRSLLGEGASEPPHGAAR